MGNSNVSFLCFFPPQLPPMQGFIVYIIDLIISPNMFEMKSTVLGTLWEIAIIIEMIMEDTVEMTYTFS